MDTIGVLDFGGQYMHLIARRVRELGVFSEILPPDASTTKLRSMKGLILSGGPNSVYSKDAPRFNPQIFRIKKPMLGICYGHQLIAKEMGGEVIPDEGGEYGYARLNLEKRARIFNSLTDGQQVWMSHGDQVKILPDGFETYASTSLCDVAAMAHSTKEVYGVQFHPEVKHTENGQSLLESFVIGVCGAKKQWDLNAYLKKIKENLSRATRGKHVLAFVSGGVDSVVATILASQVVPEGHLHPYYIDTGFMRSDDKSHVKRWMGHHKIKLGIVNAKDQFFTSLEGVSDPEEKRRLIGEKFVELKQEIIEDKGLPPDETLLLQGTIYPDTIESGGTRNSAKIKTHHNRVAGIHDLIRQGRVAEPLKDLYKDEVRELGRLLGIPEEALTRRPFPGPGLAVRILCSTPVEFDSSVNRRLAEIVAPPYKAKVLPVKSVGVQGDERTYRYPVMLEGMFDWMTLDSLSQRITNLIPEVNRVVYRVSPEAAHRIFSTEMGISRDRADRLRRADWIARSILDKHPNDVWQILVASLPFGIDSEGESLVLRPVDSTEAMTARFSQLPYYLIHSMARRLMKIKGVTAVLYDITNKPPATIEWE